MFNILIFYKGFPNFRSKVSPDVSKYAFRCSHSPKVIVSNFGNDALAGCFLQWVEFNKFGKQIDNYKNVTETTFDLGQTSIKVHSC